MVEDVLTTMKSLLELYTDTELEKQDGKYTDGITLDSLAEVVIGDNTISEKGLPRVALMPEGSEIEHYASNKKDVDHQISLRIVVTDTDQDAAQKRLWRTMRAVESVLEIHAPGTDNIIDYRTEDMQYFVPADEDSDESATEKAGLIMATVKERQDAYVATQL